MPEPEFAEFRSPDKSRYTPIDHQISSAIENEKIDELLDLSIHYAFRVGDVLGTYEDFLVRWEGTYPDVLKKLLILTWSRLNRKVRRRFMHLIIGMIYRLARDVGARIDPATVRTKTDLSGFREDDHGPAGSIVQRMDRLSPFGDTVFAGEAEAFQKATVIILDASISMQGLNLFVSALAASALAMNLNPRDQYAVVMFSELYKVFKKMDQSKEIDEVINDIMSSEPVGRRTNLSVGLSAGFLELQKVNFHRKTGILLTDGWHNVGEDPVTIAAKFSPLHIIHLPGGNPALAIRLAKVGSGHFIPVNGILDVYDAVFSCLM